MDWVIKLKINFTAVTSSSMRHKKSFIKVLVPGAIPHFVVMAPGFLLHIGNCVVGLTDQKRFQHSRYVLCFRGESLLEYWFWFIKNTGIRTIRARESICLLMVGKSF